MPDSLIQPDSLIHQTVPHADLGCHPGRDHSHILAQRPSPGISHGRTFPSPRQVGEAKISVGSNARPMWHKAVREGHSESLSLIL